jgi:hypothetical protein
MNDVHTDVEFMMDKKEDRDSNTGEKYLLSVTPTAGASTNGRKIQGLFGWGRGSLGDEEWKGKEVEVARLTG